MRLYTMELYKICSKKVFLFSAMASLVILLLYFWSFVRGTDCTVNGVRYEGLAAVRMDRQITKEFQGVVTDQKLAQIIEKYGFPDGVRENYNIFLNRNYLNSYVMREFSDGYFYSWEDYRVGTCTYPIAETELGKASAATGKALVLEYSYGWNVFFEVLQFGCILGMILIALAIAPVFSEEGSMNTRQLLFTTKEGKNKDITAKLAAGITVAISVYIVFVLLDLLLVWAIFGLDGGNSLSSVALEDFLLSLNEYDNSSTWYIKDFALLSLASCLIGMIEAAAVVLYCSAHCNSPFQSVIMSALCLSAPVALNLIGRGNFNSIFFIVSQLFDVLLIGIAVMCFVSDSLMLKSLCCILPAAVGLYFRRIFPFYYTTPVMMNVPGAIADLDWMRMHYPWLGEAVFCFAVATAVIFVVCSRKKYTGN